jgi:ubiquinone biosynthesis protein
VANFWRLCKILYIFTRYRLDDLLPTEQFPLSLRIVLWLAPWRLAPVPKNLSRGDRLRLALEALGPIFIKFGQILSTRPDLVPSDIVNELVKLQDNVPPFSSKEAIQLIESQLGESVDTLFAKFDPTPMASASIAQVHPATLHDGTKVVVKVVRPGIDKTIDRDMILLDQMAHLIEKYSSEGRRLKPVEIVEDYSNTIHAELNLAIEASNATQLKRNFEGSDLLYVPEVYWDLTSTSVMVSERIYGIPVSNIAALKAQNTNMKALAERGVELFFTQVFRDSFFHADMHPGNIFVAHGSPETPKYIAIDCAIVGTLSELDQQYLARNLLAFFNQDYYQVAQLHVDSGWVPADTKVHELESAIRCVCEPIFEKPISEISFGQVLLQLFSVARRFEMEVQPQLVLLQKTLLNIEGLGRQLYPELDLWNTAKPYMERWVKERFGPQSALRELKRQLPNWIEKGPQLPGLIHSSLTKLSQIDSSQAQISNQISQLNLEIIKQRQQNRQQKLALTSMVSGGFFWWQAAALAVPETLGISLAALGAVWLIIRG